MKDELQLNTISMGLEKQSVNAKKGEPRIVLKENLIYVVRKEDIEKLKTEE